MAKRTRADAGAAAQRTVKTSVPLPADIHAKLAWLAASSGRERGEIAAGYIADAVKHIVIQDRGRDDQEGQAGGESAGGAKKNAPIPSV